MNKLDPTELTGHSDKSLNDALEQAVADLTALNQKVEVVETLSINKLNTSNYKIKLKATQEELCEDV